LIIIGICGGSASGKTTFAGELIKELGGDYSSCLHLDDYYIDFVKKGADPSEINYDHPGSTDITLFTHDLLLLKQDYGVDSPVYDFKSHTRLKKVCHITPRRYLLVDGLYLFNIPSISSFFDIKIYVETPATVRLERRIIRDRKYRNRTPESIIMQYNRFVKPMHEQYVEPNRELADIVVEGNGDVQHQVEKILGLLDVKK